MTKQDQFKQRFVKVMGELQTHSKDPELLAQIGTLAGGLAERLNQTSWTGVKSVIKPEEYNEVLGAFERTGKNLVEAGNQKKAFAVQVVASSLIAMTQRDDPRILSGERLIDYLIDRTVAQAARAPAQSTSTAG
jgi:hypothetical protein